MNNSTKQRSSKVINVRPAGYKRILAVKHEMETEEQRIVSIKDVVERLLDCYEAMNPNQTWMLTTPKEEE